MKQKSRGCEDSLEVNVTRDDGDEVHCNGHAWLPSLLESTKEKKSDMKHGS